MGLNPRITAALSKCASYAHLACLMVLIAMGGKLFHSSFFHLLGSFSITLGSIFCYRVLKIM
jgi:hypothetical protein